MPVTLPFTFSPNTVADATQVNANFNVLTGLLSGTAPATSLVVSQNAAALPVSPDANRVALLHLGGADAKASDVLIDAWGATPLLTLRHARGTAATPTATQALDLIGGVEGFGRGATAYASGPSWQIIGGATENWTDVAQGAQINFLTVAVGSTTAIRRAIIQMGLQVGAPTGGDMGAGTINCTGLYVNGVALTVP